MQSLQEKLANFGFESNDDYEYQLRCIFSSPFTGIKAINIEGHKGRRKTAFASALSRALDYPHLLYYDFTQQGEIEGKLVLPRSEDEQGVEEQAVSDFDHIMSEACAFSEGEKTVLILDQLQAADFREHIRIYQFVKNAEWSYSQVSLKAGRKNLLLLLISEEPLYHSIQKCSFRIWINAISTTFKDYAPADFDLADDILPVLDILGSIFDYLKVTPTFSEYKNILHDVQYNIHTEQHLIHSLYGWMEGVNRELLFSKQLAPVLTETIGRIQSYHGVDEVTLSEVPLEQQA